MYYLNSYEDVIDTRIGPDPIYGEIYENKHYANEGLVYYPHPYEGVIDTRIGPDPIYGEIDHSKRMPIISLYKWLDVESQEGIFSGGEILAKYRYNAQSDKLSRIG